MKVIDRQFLKEILLSASFVLMALVALFAFFDLVNKMDDVSSKEYSIGTAFLLTSLVLPARIYEVMPLAVLLAAVYTMSRWSANSEFTVLRVAGMSPLRLVRALVIPGVLLAAVTYGFGEYVAPWADRCSAEIRSGDDSTITARGYSTGVWVRDLTQNEKSQQVDRYINVKSLSASSMGKTGAWRLFEFDLNGKLVRLIRAESATFEPGRGWHLHDAVTVTYPQVDMRTANVGEANITISPATEFFLPSSLEPEILGVMTAKTENMSMRSLSRYLAHLEKTSQESERYRVAFWTKAFYPLAIFVMLALSMPFAYMNSRSGGVAIKIFLGVMIGIAFYALNNLFSYLGIVNTWSPIVVSILPTFVMLLIAAGAMYAVERR